MQDRENPQKFAKDEKSVRRLRRTLKNNIGKSKNDSGLQKD
jgi:hypothetical protein